MENEAGSGDGTDPSVVPQQQTDTEMTDAAEVTDSVQPTLQEDTGSDVPESISLDPHSILELLNLEGGSAPINEYSPSAEIHDLESIQELEETSEVQHIQENTSLQELISHVEEPTIEEPTTEKPIIEELTIEEPTIEEPTIEEPTIEEPTTEEPTIEKFSVEPAVNLAPIADALSRHLEVEREELQPVVTTTVSPNTTNQESDLSQKLDRVAMYLNVDSSSLPQLPNIIIDALLAKTSETESLRSDLQFVQLNSEKITSLHQKKFKELQDSLNTNSDKVQSLLAENESLLVEKNEALKELSLLKDKEYQLQNHVYELERKDMKSVSDYSQLMSNNQKEILSLNESVNKLTKTNIELNTKVNELVKELNEVRNANFDTKLSLTKAANEKNFLQEQNAWFETELTKAQNKLTVILKRSESDYITSNNEIITLKSSNDSLRAKLQSELELVKSLRKSLEDKTSEHMKLQSSFVLEKSKFERSLANSDELVELSKIQISQRQERIDQLENYVNEIKERTTNSVSSLESELKEKTAELSKLKEKLRYTQEALESELHKETQLPHLDSTSDLLINELGINLASLYTDYSQLKKQLILERSQKNTLQQQLTQFVQELEAKKPTIASYQNQIAFYKSAYNDTLGKVELINFEKLEREKDCGKLKFKLNDLQSEVNSLKKLSKDLGRQLCYYLIHSKIREDGDSPLAPSERKAIDAILKKSGLKDDSVLNGLHTQSDTDELISSRLVEFSSIIELQEKNEQLLMVSRQLGQKLEFKESERDSIESEAIEEAKEAILTLEGELQTVQLKLEAVTKERDAIKDIQQSNNLNGSTYGTGYEVKHLNQVNDDLRKRLSDVENSLKEVEGQSKLTVTSLNDKLRNALNSKNDLKLQISNMKHSVELAETKLGGLQKLLDNSLVEISQLKKDGEFWRTQSSKQEKLLLDKLNELRDLEQSSAINQITLSSLKNELRMKSSLIESTEKDIEQLRKEKNQLNEFVLNLQALFKESEASTKELTERLNRSIENYQNLQEKLTDREEKLLLISNQSELAWKAQNTKLEQVNELSQLLLDAKTNLKKKEHEVIRLNEQINDLYTQLQATKNRQQLSFISSSSTSASDSERTRLVVELEQLKEELLVAEAQANEMTTIAKSAESALSNATKTFEAYRAENDSKYNALLREKVLLEDEITELKKEKQANAEKLQLTNLNFSDVISRLRLELDSANQKAIAYDLLKRETDAKFTSLNNELEIQATILQEAQTKYQTELRNKESLNQKVAELNESVALSQATINKLTDDVLRQKAILVTKEEELVQDNENIKKELETVSAQLLDFRQQNAILMNQLEVTNGKIVDPIDGDQSTGSSADELRQVIAYLRSESQSSEARAISANEEKVKLSQRVHQLTSELEVSQSELAKLRSSHVDTSDIAKQHEKLKEQLEQLNILRESNMTLRNENSQHLQRAQELESQSKNLKQELAPLQVEVKKLSSEISVKDQQVQLTAEENERLKSRLNNLTSQLSSVTTQLEEATATPKASLVQPVDSTSGDAIAGSPPPVNEQEYELLKQKYNNIRDKANAKLQSQNERIKSLSESVTKLREELDKKEELGPATQTLVEEREKLQAQLQQTKQENANELEKLKTSFESEKQALEIKLKNDYESKLVHINASPDQATADNSEVIKKLEEEHNKRVAEITKSHETKLKQLEDQILEKVKQAREDSKKQTEKLYDMKMRMLNKKLERLGGDANAATNTTTTVAASTPQKLDPVTNSTKPATNSFGAQLFGGYQPQPQMNIPPMFQPNNANVFGMNVNPFAQAAAFGNGSPFTFPSGNSQTMTPNTTPAKLEQPKENPSAQLGPQFTENTLTVRLPNSDNDRKRAGEPASQQQNQQKKPHTDKS